VATSSRYVPTKSPYQSDAALRAYLEREFQSIARAIVPLPSPLGVDVRDYGVVGDGVTDDTEAINAALSASPYGATVWLPVTAAGYRVDGSIICEGRTLAGMGAGSELALNFFSSGGSINSASLPGGVMLIVTSSSAPPIILRSNGACVGLTFWYPEQNWDITSLGDSFVTYPPAVQLGDATDPGPSHPCASLCQFLGATRMVGQYADDGTSVKGGSIDGCTGVLMGEFLYLARSTDLIQVSRCQFTPNAVTAYVADSSVGGDATVFRTRAALDSAVFRLGGIDGIYISGVFAFGARYYVHAAADMFTGDTNEGVTFSITDSGIDSAHQVFRIERSQVVFGAFVANFWGAPLLRPNGVAGDSATQAFLYLEAGVQELRIELTNVRTSGAAVGEFSAGYSGARDRDFIAGGALGSAVIVHGTNGSASNLNTELMDSTMRAVTKLKNWSANDVEQDDTELAVIATGSLPAAAAAEDGRAVIEDNGSGDRNLIIYAGGQRFRIDGGSAF
jgi:hypothetical protein